MVDIAAIPQSEERDRTLNDQEIALVVHAAMLDGYPFGVLTRMLLLTAQRRNEVAGMQWAELDLVNNIWTIPKERTKMKAGGSHRPYFPAVSRSLRSNQAQGPYVFTSRVAHLLLGSVRQNCASMKY
jgi:integrase